MKTIFKTVLIVYSFLFWNHSFASIKNPAPLFNNLGKFHRAISTKNPLAQRYFDQGLILFYSFEYGEAIRSFKAATEVDPDCAMCYWGLALALGSKTNTPLNGHEIEDAQKNLNLAMKKVDKLNLSERLYIAALAQRYNHLSPKKLDLFAGLCSSYSGVSGSDVGKYASAMKKVSLAFPDDPDAKTLYAMSLFDLDQWHFWDQADKPNTHTLETIKELESALKIAPDHPGANHLFVHIIEFSPYPAKSIPNAERLGQLVPGSEHLAHMPCHTYFSVGNYHDAVIANQLAIQRYKNYVSICKAQGFLPETQYLYFHNYDFLVAAASMEGRKQLSLTTAFELETQILPLAEHNPALQKGLTDYILMLARFGDWDTILKTPAPDAKFQYALAIWYYAKGLADVQTNPISDGMNDLKKLQKIIKQGPVDANLSKIGFALLKIAENTLQAVIAHHAGHPHQAFQFLHQAITLQDSVFSPDPPPWYFPTRELLGEYLLQSKEFSKAKILFLEDLKRHPENGWSLYGLAVVEHHLGNEVAAQKAMEKFKIAWKYADIKAPVYPL